jgi:enoyl-CoA hydratase
MTQYTSPTDRVQAWTDAGTLHIRFNNPARHNALSVDMWQAIPPLLAQAEADHAIRLVVFSGAGEKAFVSGADISQFEDMRAAREAVTHYEKMAEEALMGIYRFSKPTLACIRGWCIGGGVNVAISCDIRIAADDAVFSIPAAKLGLGYRYSALKNLVHLVGVGAAKDLFFTGRRIDAAEARALGLVTRTCAVNALPGLLAEYVETLQANAPLTIRAGKRIIEEILKDPADLDRSLCQQLIRDCFESEDYAEGRRAFMAKRKPTFRGR